MYLHISNHICKQDQTRWFQNKTEYCQEYTEQCLTNVGANRKSLAIATVKKMEGRYTMLESHTPILTTDKKIMITLQELLS